MFVLKSTHEKEISSLKAHINSIESLPFFNEKKAKKYDDLLRNYNSLVTLTDKYKRENVEFSFSATLLAQLNDQRDVNEKLKKLLVRNANALCEDMNKILNEKITNPERFEKRI